MDAFFNSLASARKSFAVPLIAAGLIAGSGVVDVEASSHIDTTDNEIKNIEVAETNKVSFRNDNVVAVGFDNTVYTSDEALAGYVRSPKENRELIYNFSLDKVKTIADANGRFTADGNKYLAEFETSGIIYLPVRTAGKNDVNGRSFTRTPADLTHLGEYDDRNRSLNEFRSQMRSGSRIAALNGGIVDYEKTLPKCFVPGGKGAEDFKALFGELTQENAFFVIPFADAPKWVNEYKGGTIEHYQLDGYQFTFEQIEYFLNNKSEFFSNRAVKVLKEQREAILEFRREAVLDGTAIYETVKEPQKLTYSQSNVEEMNNQVIEKYPELNEYAISDVSNSESFYNGDLVSDKYSSKVVTSIAYDIDNVVPLATVAPLGLASGDGVVLQSSNISDVIKDAREGRDSMPDVDASLSNARTIYVNADTSQIDVQKVDKEKLNATDISDLKAAYKADNDISDSLRDIHTDVSKLIGTQVVISKNINEYNDIKDVLDGKGDSRLAESYRFHHKDGWEAAARSDMQDKLSIIDKELVNQKDLVEKNISVKFSDIKRASEQTDISKVYVDNLGDNINILENAVKDKSLQDMINASQGVEKASLEMAGVVTAHEGSIRETLAFREADNFKINTNEFFNSAIAIENIPEITSENIKDISFDANYLVKNFQKLELKGYDFDINFVKNVQFLKQGLERGDVELSNQALDTLKGRLETIRDMSAVKQEHLDRYKFIVNDSTVAPEKGMSASEVYRIYARDSLKETNSFNIKDADIVRKMAEFGFDQNEIREALKENSPNFVPADKTIGNERALDAFMSQVDERIERGEFNVKSSNFYPMRNSDSGVAMVKVEYEVKGNENPEEVMKAFLVNQFESDGKGAGNSQVEATLSKIENDGNGKYSAVYRIAGVVGAIGVGSFIGSLALKNHGLGGEGKKHLEELEKNLQEKSKELSKNIDFVSFKVNEIKEVSEKEYVNALDRVDRYHKVQVSEVSFDSLSADYKGDIEGLTNAERPYFEDIKTYFEKDNISFKENLGKEGLLSDKDFEALVEVVDNSSLDGLRQAVSGCEMAYNSPSMDAVESAHNNFNSSLSGLSEILENENNSNNRFLDVLKMKDLTEAKDLSADDAYRFYACDYLKTSLTTEIDDEKVIESMLKADIPQEKIVESVVNCSPVNCSLNTAQTKAYIEEMVKGIASGKESVKNNTLDVFEVLKKEVENFKENVYLPLTQQQFAAKTFTGYLEDAFILSDRNSGSALEFDGSYADKERLYILNACNSVEALRDLTVVVNENRENIAKALKAIEPVAKECGFDNELKKIEKVFEIYNMACFRGDDKELQNSRLSLDKELNSLVDSIDEQKKEVQLEAEKVALKDVPFRKGMDVKDACITLAAVQSNDKESIKNIVDVVKENGYSEQDIKTVPPEYVSSLNDKEIKKQIDIPIKEGLSDGPRLDLKENSMDILSKGNEKTEKMNLLLDNVRKDVVRLESFNKCAEDIIKIADEFSGKANKEARGLNGLENGMMSVGMAKEAYRAKMVEQFKDKVNSLKSIFKSGNENPLCQKVSNTAEKCFESYMNNKVAEANKFADNLRKYQAELKKEIDGKKLESERLEKISESMDSLITPDMKPKEVYRVLAGISCLENNGTVNDVKIAEKMHDMGYSINSIVKTIKSNSPAYAAGKITDKSLEKVVDKLEGIEKAAEAKFEREFKEKVNSFSANNFNSNENIKANSKVNNKGKGGMDI